MLNLSGYNNYTHICNLIHFHVLLNGSGAGNKVDSAGPNNASKQFAIRLSA
jgi:hypothetical protein